MKEPASSSTDESKDCESFERTIFEFNSRQSVTRARFFLLLLIGLMASLGVFVMFGASGDGESNLLNVGRWAPIAHSRIQCRVDSATCMTIVIALMALMTSVIIAIRAGSKSEGIVQEVDDYLWRSYFDILASISPIVAVVFAVFSWFGDLSGGDVSTASGATVCAFFTVLVSSAVHRDRSRIGPAIAYADARQRLADYGYLTERYANLLSLARKDRRSTLSNLIVVANTIVLSAVYLYGSLLFAMVVHLIAGGSVAAPGQGFFFGSLILIGVYVAITRVIYEGFIDWVATRQESESRPARVRRWIRYQFGAILAVLAVGATLIGTLASRPDGVGQIIFSIMIVAVPIVLWAVPYLLLPVVVRVSPGGDAERARGTVRGLVVQTSRWFMRPLADLIDREVERDRRSAQRVCDEYMGGAA